MFDVALNRQRFETRLPASMEMAVRREVSDVDIGVGAGESESVHAAAVLCVQRRLIKNARAERRAARSADVCSGVCSCRARWCREYQAPSSAFVSSEFRGTSKQVSTQTAWAREAEQTGVLFVLHRGSVA